MGVSTDERWMRVALDEADQAAGLGEVPVGAVLVREGKVLAQAGNRTIERSDPTAHAEMLTLRAAAATIGNHRLVGSTLYVTVEPCMMCAGALVHARVQRLVFGALEPKAGAVVSHPSLGREHLNHQVAVDRCLGELCGERMTSFFAARRAAHRAERQQTGSGEAS